MRQTRRNLSSGNYTLLLEPIEKEPMDDENDEIPGCDNIAILLLLLVLRKSIAGEEEASTWDDTPILLADPPATE